MPKINYLFGWFTPVQPLDSMHASCIGLVHIVCTLHVYIIFSGSTHTVATQYSHNAAQYSHNAGQVSKCFAWCMPGLNGVQFDVHCNAIGRNFDCGGVFLQDLYNGTAFNMAPPLQKRLHNFSLLWISFGLATNRCLESTKNDTYKHNTSLVTGSGLSGYLMYTNERNGSCWCVRFAGTGG